MKLGEMTGPEEVIARLERRLRTAYINFVLRDSTLSPT
ncbi:uncharacterized protein METZ01_LOCUS231120, partial [marine metagenome]